MNFSQTSEVQYTQEGQAISYNNLICQQMIELFEPCLGPNGTFKALVNGANQLNITKDGIALCRELKFNHPTSIVITRSANNIFERVGDGITTYILLVCNIFSESFNYYLDGSKIPLIINSLQLAANDVSQYLKAHLLPFNDANLKLLIETSLCTKLRNCHFLSDIIIQSLKHTADIKLIEILKMDGGDIRDSIFVPGLVLDHGPRHQSMPMELYNVCILVTNMSLEYEKPEINAEFVYNSIEQRENLAKSEGDFIRAKVNVICQLAIELKKKNKFLAVFNEKGIDPPSLEQLAQYGILGLRRVKRRNLERLINICGGKIITQPEQVCDSSLGFCKQVTVKKVGEETYTFVEGVPLKGACTIVIRGNIDFNRIKESIKGPLISVMIALNDKCCIRGGKQLYIDLIQMIQSKTIHPKDSVGYAILSKVFEKICKILIKNEKKNVQEEWTNLLTQGDTKEVIDNATVVGNVLTNSIYTAINLLMCDEIILAGKSIKQ